MISKLQVDPTRVKAMAVPFLKEGLLVRVYRMLVSTKHTKDIQLTHIDVSECGDDTKAPTYSVMVPIDDINAFVDSMLEHGTELLLRMEVDSRNIVVMYEANQC